AWLGDQGQGLVAGRRQDGANAMRPQQRIEAVAHESIVLDEKNGAIEGCERLRSLRVIAALRIRKIAGDRNFDRESRAFAGLRPHVDIVTQELSQPPNDGEPQSEAAELLALGSLIVLLEDARHLLSHDPDAAVPHLDANVVTTTPAAQQDRSAFG